MPTPLVEIPTNSADFGLCSPGPQAPQQIILTVNGSSAVSISMAIQGAQDAGFVAKLYNVVSHGPVVGPGGKILEGAGSSVNYLASTQGPTFSASIPPTPGVNTGSPGGNSDLFGIEIDFTAPATPMPNKFSGLLEVAWEGGSAEITLTGTTAQLLASVASKQPIPLTPGGNATASILLQYDTCDVRSSLNVQIGPPAAADPPNSGITIPSKVVTIEPQELIKAQVIMSEGVVEKAGTGVVAKGPVPVTAPTLTTSRSQTYDLLVSANIDAIPGKSQASYIGISASQLPEQIGGIQDLKILFDIPPLPVKLSVIGGPFVVLVGDSCKIILNVSAPGAQTTLHFGEATTAYESSIPGGASASGNANLKVNTGGSYAVGGVAGDHSYTSVTVAVQTPSSAAGGVVTISLPWTAYDGQFSGTTLAQVTMLPKSVQFSGNLNYAKMTGNYTWALNSDGYSYFSGSVTVPYTEVASQSYSCGVALSATNSKGTKVLVTHSGTMGSPIFGTFLGDDSDSWSDAGKWNSPGSWLDSTDPVAILSAWQQICNASATHSSNYSPDALDIVVGILTGVLPVEAIVDGVVQAAIKVAPYIKCIWSWDDSGGDGGGEDDDGGGDFEDSPSDSGSLDCSG